MSGASGRFCGFSADRCGVRLLAIAPFVLGARCGRPYPGTNARLAANAAEESSAWLIEYLEFCIVLGDAELIECRFFCFGD